MEANQASLSGISVDLSTPTPALVEARKFDDAKVRVDLVPRSFIEAAARAFSYGAKKYAAYNYLAGQGLEHHRLYGALLRHLLAYWSGEDNDPESGLSHLDHAAASLAMLIEHKARAKGVDDRYKEEK